MEPGTIDVVLSYCHNSLNNSLLKGQVPYLKSKGVGIISASPLSMGLLAPQVSHKQRSLSRQLLLVPAKRAQSQCSAIISMHWNVNMHLTDCQTQMPKALAGED